MTSREQRLEALLRRWLTQRIGPGWSELLRDTHAALAKQPKEETAWLIERPGPEWLKEHTPDCSGIWTTDPNKALRYYTKESAEREIVSEQRPLRMLVVGTATQHSWVDLDKEYWRRRWSPLGGKEEQP